MQERALSSYEPPSISPPLFDGAKQKNDSEIEKSGKKVLTEGRKRAKIIKLSENDERRHKQTVKSL